jgi:PAS domain S-box-containing protein
MDGLDTTLFFISAVLQLAAIVFAVLMARQVNDRRPWLVLMGALLLMLIGRILFITLPTSVRDHINPTLAITISLLLLIAMFAIRRVAVAERLSKESATRSAAERDESENRYRSLVELSPDSLLVHMEGRIVYANPAAVRLLAAKDLNALVGKSVLDLVSPRSRGIAEARMGVLMVHGGTVPPIEQEWTKLDGTCISVEAIGSVVPWRGGKGLQVIVRDISERKRAEEERAQLLANERAARTAAEHASRMKDEFLATLSHELRTPLSAIVGWSHLLMQGANNEADLRQGLSTIERNARIQTQLIEDLLDMSRIISGKLRLDIQRVLPVTFVEAAIDSVRPAADAKGIQLVKTLDSLAGPIAGDPSRLQQIVWNLLSNAIKFTPRGGKVQVVLQRVNSHIEMSVADTGQGIAPDFLPYVFDRFRQADASTTRKQGGLGIGLAIVKQLVELHGGSVHVASEGEGKGATFSVHLPISVVHAHLGDVDRQHPRVSGERAVSKPAVVLSGIEVLVVDDEQDARDLIRHILEDHEAEVLTAGSATEAMSLMEQQKPDVLVSDIGMPNVDGYDFLKQVRTLGVENGARIPAIALTAFARSEDRTRALMSGYQVHVAKPVEPAELVATVASVVGRTGDGRG